MKKKYFCPKCQKELKEEDVVRGSCPYCHAIFDTPIVKNVPDEEKINSAISQLIEIKEKEEGF